MPATASANRVLQVARFAARLPRRRPLILMYHAFGAAPATGDPYDLFLPQTHLEQQLDVLLGAGWHPIDLDGWLTAYESGGSAAGLFHVTIDDGFDSVASVAAPVLQARSVPATLFVLSGLMGRTSSWLEEMPDAPLASAQQLRELTDMGVTLGVHGHDHQALTQLDAASLDLHTSLARASVAEVTGVAPRAFAYPFGWHDARARNAVARAGYDVGFSLYDDAGRYAVSRVDVKPTDSLATFCVKLIPNYRRVWRLAGTLRPIRRHLRRATDRVT